MCDISDLMKNTKNNTYVVIADINLDKEVPLTSFQTKGKQSSSSTVFDKKQTRIVQYIKFHPIR